MIKESEKKDSKRKDCWRNESE